MPAVTGGCHCGELSLEIEFTRPPLQYSPRACDCDFCRQHGAAYVSDPQGKLLIRASREGSSSIYRQGSGTAQFLFCSTCAVLVAVLYTEGRIFAAVNVNALPGVTFGAPSAVSPKTLSAADKSRRWIDSWFADVRVQTGS